MDRGDKSLLLQHIIGFFHGQGADSQLPGKGAHRRKNGPFRQFSVHDPLFDLSGDLLIDRLHG
jgi:hypothetical protein